MISWGSWLEALETFAVEAILERRCGKRAGLLRSVLWILSAITFLWVRFRLALFQRRIFRRRSMGCLVISVGNLTVGGTGKTPVVEMLAHQLQARGRKVAILSRGYKSAPKPLFRRILEKVFYNTQFFVPRVVSDGKTLLLDSRIAGDEPFMLANNLRGVIVLVDRDRVRSGLFAIKHFGADILLLDDGFQYLKMCRAVEIVLIDSEAPFGNEFLLPRGTLREPAKHLCRATHILITKCTREDNSLLIARIRKLNRTAEIVECTHCPRHLINTWTGEARPLKFLEGLPVGSLCGIAVPESFVNALETLGARVRLTRTYPDHHCYSVKEVQAFIRRCAQCNLQAILTTEKDAVRIPQIVDPEIPVYFMRVEVRILREERGWKNFIDGLVSLPQRIPKRFFL
ncbi:MAG: tetraacyldisaccharide 4'-kinase [Candidatus Xiphinematobacter sp.]|nr:MAG: tetraacyldisaccharide 4'-kinase [Candidatus Xiphinematobacter sp.]